MHRKPCLKDVAQAAGVHVSTVSRALNRATAGLLSPVVVDRIRAVAESMGYCPNAMAAALRTSRSGAVGMVVPDLTHPAFPHILRGAEAVLGEAGYVVLAMSVEHDFRRAEALLREMRVRQLEGILVGTAQVDDPFIAGAQADDIPMVCINATGPWPSVIVDAAKAAELVMGHLRELGHGRIGYLAGPDVTVTGRARLAAFVARGIDPDLTESAAAYDRAGARDACRRLLDRFPPGTAHGLTALTTANDVLALGCLDVMAERGLRCPHDVSLTGFMDLPNMDLIAPGLTTVRMDLLEMGQTAARILLRRMAAVQDGAPPEQVILPVELVVRGSTARPVV